MRKVDYATLARLIKTERAKLAKVYQPEGAGGVVWQDGSWHAAQRIEVLARDFAKSTSVDAVEFLTACGIKPP